MQTNRTKLRLYPGPNEKCGTEKTENKASFPQDSRLEEEEKPYRSSAGHGLDVIAAT